MRTNINRLESIRPLAGLTMEARYRGSHVVHVDMTDPVKRLAVFARAVTQSGRAGLDPPPASRFPPRAGQDLMGWTPPGKDGIEVPE